MRELILASNSPRRKELLARDGYRFRVIPTGHPEPHVTGSGLPPAQVAETLARFKAEHVAAEHPQAVVLGADTVVALGERLFGKADDEAHAREILSALAGSRHEVITAVAVICQALSKTRIAHETTGITMRPMSRAELDAYVAGGEWIDKAGAYAIQETADQYVEKVNGSFTNVIGLPMELTRRLLAEFGITPTR